MFHAWSAPNILCLSKSYDLIMMVNISIMNSLILFKNMASFMKLVVHKLHTNPTTNLLNLYLLVPKHYNVTGWMLVPMLCILWTGCLSKFLIFKRQWKFWPAISLCPHSSFVPTYIWVRSICASPKSQRNKLDPCVVQCVLLWFSP